MEGKTKTAEYGAKNVGKYINRVLVVMAFLFGVFLGILIEKYGR